MRREARALRFNASKRRVDEKRVFAFRFDKRLFVE